MSLSAQEKWELEEKALSLREKVLRMIKASGSGHLGGALSATEILTALYFRIMRVDPQRPDWPERDRFVLSAGHKCLILYAALAEKGFLPESYLDTYGDLKSPLPGHPSMEKQPGVEANTGALGHGLSIAGGMAMGLRAQEKKNRVFVLMGDGEQAEGSNWEAAAAASYHKLDNLLAFVDRNGLQIGGKTTEVMSYEPLEDRWSAFGWSVKTIDGNNIEQVVEAIESAPFEAGKPSVIIADTVKSKGLSFAEGDAAYHYWKAGADEMKTADADLKKAREILENARKGLK
ncbi:transketolase [Marispirochaeta aestuarii]|uniref:Transketolase n=1 Tax=Marispirochaeta aestuarii TaxID=1963862 RepID=A0A1Y1S2W7_9SPIO|nr:transketolase [Marispirochaeta aestuarii]ORC37712.1 transketolase [Marispirochaeta aestuarii]